MEGYDYVSSNKDENAQSRVTKGPVIDTDSDNIGIT
jgi:hypothetical protein